MHHTPKGAKLYENFVKLAGFKGDWTMAAYRAEAVAKICAQVGKGRVICGLSGGVDSSVAAVLIHEAIGDQLPAFAGNQQFHQRHVAGEIA